MKIYEIVENMQQDLDTFWDMELRGADDPDDRIFFGNPSNKKMVSLWLQKNPKKSISAAIKAIRYSNDPLDKKITTPPPVVPLSKPVDKLASTPATAKAAKQKSRFDLKSKTKNIKLPKVKSIDRGIEWAKILTPK